MLDLSRFTAEQRSVVLAPDGPLLVLAGPGSGKTTTLAARVAYLVAAGGVRPAGILALAFTTGAARELRARLVGVVGAEGRGVDITTFHAHGLRVVRHWRDALGYPEGPVAVSSPTEARELLREAADGLGLPADPPARAGLAADVERHRLAAGDRPATDRVAALTDAYEALLRRRGLVDFAGMLALPLRLLEARPDALRRLQDAYAHVLADEAQDVCAAQYRLLRHLAARHRSLVLVGDPRQALYGFRGADARYLGAFRADFPEARVLALTRNFRSTGRIVALAEAVGWSLGGPPLWTRNPPGLPAVVHGAADERSEAAYVAGRVARLRAEGVVRRLDDVAVLYRTNRQASEVALALRAAGLPCRVLGRGDPLGRREVRDALAYLRLARDPEDAVALARVVDVPPRGLARLAAGLRRRPVPARALPAAAARLGPAVQAATDDLVALVGELHARAGRRRPAEALELVLDRSGYAAWLRGRPDGATRVGHLDGLRSLARGADEELGGWLDGLDLAEGPVPEGDAAERVLLATVHAAKGGEWQVVFVVGCEDGLMPLGQPGPGEDALADERRVAFVALSRARRELVLTFCRTRRRGGGVEPRRLSRFLRGLPAGLLASVA